MTVRANVTVALLSGDQSEPDVFLQGEHPFGSREGIQEMLFAHLIEMQPEDEIWFCVIPADLSVRKENMAQPMAYYGPKPTLQAFTVLGFDELHVRAYQIHLLGGALEGEGDSNKA